MKFSEFRKTVGSICQCSPDFNGLVVLVVPSQLGYPTLGAPSTLNGGSIHIRRHIAEETSVITCIDKDLLFSRALRGLNDLPPFSPVLTMLMASLSNDDVSVPKLAALIEKDTILSGTMLRIVNSALYGRRGTVNSVSRAITIMGLLKLRNTTLGLSVNRMWKGVRTPAGWSMERFNLHSLATAILSDQLAQKLPVSYPETAFVGGLFHDLGKLIIATGLREEYDEIARLSALHPGIESELLVLGFTHAELSAAALERWNLPANVRDAVASHHAPELASKDLYDGCKFHIGHVISVADAIASVYLLQSEIAAGSAQMNEVERALETVELSEHVGEILDGFRAEFDVMQLAA